MPSVVTLNFIYVCIVCIFHLHFAPWPFMFSFLFVEAEYENKMIAHYCQKAIKKIHVVIV